MAYKRKASASQINLYNACPYKYYLKYKLGVKEPQTLALVKGSLVHAIIEEFYKLNPKECGINLRNYKEEFPKYIIKVFDKVLVMPRKSFGKDIPTFEEELKSLSNDDFEYAKEIIDVRTIIRNYMQMFLMQFEQYAKKNEYFTQAWYSARLKFSELELSSDNFIGYADGIIEKDGSLIVIDYKTSQYYKLGYSEEYERQIKLYAAMYYQLYGKIPDYGCIYFLRYGIQCLYPINKETVVDEMTNVINDFISKVKSEDVLDYPKNYNYQFCTCNMSKHKDKNWCWYSKYCNEE